MKQQSHIIDLLTAAKLLADNQGSTLLSYIIDMAVIEASAKTAERRKDEASIATKVA